MRRFLDRLAGNCRETSEQLSDYIEHELAFRRRRRVARHLRRCVRCRSLLDSLAWTIEQLRKLGGAEVKAPSVAETVVGRVRAAGAERSSR